MGYIIGRDLQCSSLRSTRSCNNILQVLERHVSVLLARDLSCKYSMPCSLDSKETHDLSIFCFKRHQSRRWLKVPVHAGLTLLGGAGFVSVPITLQIRFDRRPGARR